MDISVLTTTNDIEQLCTLALAMVQKVMSENEEKEKLQQRIRLQEEMLKLARQQRFGKKCETLAGMQRSVFEEDVDADIAALTAHPDRLLPPSTEEKKHLAHSLLANRFRCTFHVRRSSLSRRQPKVAPTARAHCATSGMK